MIETAAHPLIDRYLRDFERVAQALPDSERRELVAEIRAHFRERVGPSPSEAEVLNVIDELGKPEAIVASAAPNRNIRGPGRLEVLAVLFLSVGGVVIPVFGWLVGLALLWASSAWSVRSKWLGTLVFPGGIAPPLWLLLFWPSPTPPTWIAVPLIVVLAAAPMVVAGVLVGTAKRQQ